MYDEPSLRKKMREHRRHLSPELCENASQLLFKSFLRLVKLIPPFRHIAVYLAFDGEINLKYIVQWLWQQRKICYLPVLPCSGAKEMQFAVYNENSILQNNRFNIPEPEGQARISACELDLILLPLVAFDKTGHRLGMGGGFYDYTLREINSSPFLLGCAYESQCVSHLIVKSTDVNMNAVITEKDYYLSH